MNANYIYSVNSVIDLTPNNILDCIFLKYTCICSPAQFLCYHSFSDFRIFL